MRSRNVRLAAVVVGVLALFGSAMPAQATSIRLVAFQGTATVANGLDGPCFQTVSTAVAHLTTTTNPLLTFNLPCPPLPVGPECLGLPTLPTPNCHLETNHGNTQGVGVVSTVCVDVGVNVAKAGKDPAHAGTCTFVVNGTVEGWCGLSEGQVSGGFTDALGQTFSVDIHFTGLASTVYFTGHATKLSNGQRGLVAGLLEAVPPTPALNGTESCADKTARTFLLLGEAVIVTA